MERQNDCQTQPLAAGTRAASVAADRTKEDTVNEALKEYIQRCRQAKITDLFATSES